MKSYQDLLWKILTKGEGHADRTKTGTLSLFGEQWRHSMSDGFPLLTTKKVPLRWIFEELMWFLKGSTKNADLKSKGVDIWDEWSTEKKCEAFGREAGDLGPIYGWQWRRFGEKYGVNGAEPGVDQIANLLKALECDPLSRRLIVNAWHPLQQGQVTLPPCHTMFQLKVHENDKMSLHLYARSIDAFLGLPFNIASYALLLTMLCKVTRRHPQDLVISFGDVHIYRNHITQAKEQISRTPYPLPTISLQLPKAPGSLNQLTSFKYEDVTLVDYVSHGKLPAPVAV